LPSFHILFFFPTTNCPVQKQQKKGQVLGLAILAGPLLSTAGGSVGLAGTHATVGVLLLLFRRLQDLEGAHEGLINTHHRASVVELTAVVGSREQSHELPLGKELVAILHNLRRRKREGKFQSAHLTFIHKKN